MNELSRAGVSEGVLKGFLDPFPESDIEWRVKSSGKDGERVWVSVLAYVSNRAIMNRLDDLIGPSSWQNVFKVEAGGMVCGIGILVEGEWVWKYDGAQETEFEPFKGGLSGSMKRAAVQWGMGRYLYNLDATYAKISMEKRQGWKRDKLKDGGTFYWETPKLPAWALPGGDGAPGIPSRPAAASSSPAAKPVQAKAPVNADEAQDVTLEDMTKAEERAQASGITPGAFKMAWVISTGKTTPKGKIDYVRITRGEYKRVWAALESPEAVQKLVNEKKE